ncbi:MAG TPA: hypothetical protein VKB19_13700 [Pedobacter sp.]|nr:hypothetical protein [Pedobacter sp.]
MLIKLNPIIHAFARQKDEVQPKELTRQQRVNYDRIVIVMLFLVVIAGAIFLQ